MGKHTADYLPGHTLKLLQDGDEFFADVLQQIPKAKYEIFIETFILADDEVGRKLSEALKTAARHGVRVCVTVDSFGSWYLPEGYIRELSEAGVIFQIYDPQPDWIKLRPKIFRRLHRKLVTIDKLIGYAGGINFCEDHLLRARTLSKRDYAVRVEGPIVSAMRDLCFSYAPVETDPRVDAEAQHSLHDIEQQGTARAAFIARDNFNNRGGIEAAYIAAMKQAQHRIYIANAYFFPGYRFIRALRLAVKRGVDVKIIFQGNPDVSFAARATRSLYSTLTRLGIDIYEYIERPLHAKVALIDDEWSCVGSSNLDPWSLSLNLEANVFILDREFNQQLAKSMDTLLQHSRKVTIRKLKKLPRLRLIKDSIVYHILRWWPQFIDWIPNPAPKIRRIRRNENSQIEGTILSLTPSEAIVRTREVKKEKA